MQSGVKHFDLQFETLIQPSIHNELILSLFCMLVFFSLHFLSYFSFFFLLNSSLVVTAYFLRHVKNWKCRHCTHITYERKERKKRKDQRYCSPFLIKWWQLFYFIFTFFVRSFDWMNQSFSCNSRTFFNISPLNMVFSSIFLNDVIAYNTQLNITRWNVHWDVPFNFFSAFGL